MQKVIDLQARKESDALVAGIKKVCDEFAATLPRFSEQQIEEAFKVLEGILSVTILRTSEGKGRRADADEFMLIPTEDVNFWHFKHSDTRNYIYVNKKTGKALIPMEDKPFNRGLFDKF